MSHVSIYTLSNPIDGLVRYIGRTKGDLATRLIQHRSDGKRLNNKRACWIKSLAKKGIEPLIEEIDSVSEDDASFFEKHYIKLFKSLGARLTNDTEGGEGVKGRPLTSENKAKISQGLKGRIFSEEHRKRLGESNTRRAKKGHTISEKAKLNIRNSAPKKAILMFDLNGTFIKKFDGIRICADEMNLHSSSITNFLKGKANRVGNYKFKYA